MTSLISKNNVIDGKIYSSVKFTLEANNISITAYCGNDKVTGKIVTEKIMSSGTIEKSSDPETSYVYINKNIDLRLLELENKYDTAETFVKQNTYANHFVSNSTNKIATFAFVFDLEDFLNKNSRTFNILKNNSIYKQKILSTSSIITDSIKFYKKSVYPLESEYESIDTEARIIKTEDGVQQARYIISASDDNRKLDNYKKYSLKVSFNIKNGADKFIGEDLLKNLSLAKAFIEKDKQEQLITKFNEYLNAHRRKYNSLFLTNYRENNRKRISFDLVYSITEYILDNFDDT